MLKTLFATHGPGFRCSRSARAPSRPPTLATEPAPVPPAADAPASPGDDCRQTAARRRRMAPDAETAQEPTAPGRARWRPQDPMVGEAPMLTPVATGDISADTLIGANIQTMDGENIAEVRT